MNVQRAICATALAVSFSASAADLFFVVGQANTSWRGESAATAAAVPGDTKLLTWNAASKFTSIAGLASNDDSPVGALDGVVPSFANTWFGLSKSAAHFAIYRKPQVALTQAGVEDVKANYWTDYTGKVYQDALRSFREAQQSAAFASPEGIQRRYLIWVQNEADARAGISAKDYQTKLGELFGRFNKDLGTDGNKPFDAMFIVSSGPMRDAAGDSSRRKGSKAEPSYLDKVNAIVQAQDNAAAEDNNKIVMISRSLRGALGACAEGQGSPNCETKDLLHHHAWLYESLGAEMARNAFTYHAKGIKPLSPAHCKQDPATCASTVDVYRWVSKANADAASVTVYYGTEPYELDDTAYRFTGTRFALFQDNAPGRIPLYRSTEAGKPSLTAEPGNAKAKPLGYCYATPTGNAVAKLVAVQQDDGGKAGVLRYPGDVGAEVAAALPSQSVKTLCYVS